MEVDDSKNSFLLRIIDNMAKQGMASLSGESGPHVSRYFPRPSVPTSSKINTENLPVGLINLGSTCWFNVAVQILYHIPAFRQLILQFVPPQTTVPIPSMDVLVGLQELFVSITFSDEKLIDPSRAVNSIGKLLGQGLGQQDACEFLGVVLNRIREINPHVIEQLFIGSCIPTNLMESSSIQRQEFMQYTLQVNEDATLLGLLEQSLKSHSQVNPSSLRIDSPHTLHSSLPLEHPKLCFSNLPPVFLIDLCRLVSGTNPTELIKSNHKMTFPSLVFMDRFLSENSEKVLQLDRVLKNISSTKKGLAKKLRSLVILHQDVPQLKKLYENYQETVGETSVNFDLLRSLNLTWETEIQSKMNEHRHQSQQLNQQLEHIRSRKMHICRPYQLHAVMVHAGQSDGGHYWIYVWDSQQNHWYHIDDKFTRQVTWDVIVKTSFGGTTQESSAHCLIYLDVPKTYSLLDMKEEYDIGPMDVLRYLKDHTDVRTRHSAYGKSQTIAAVRTTIAAHSNEMDPSVLLFRALDSERQRLYSVCQESMSHNGEEERLLHFGVYLLANQVEFEPFVYWALLQHFASFALLAEEGTSRFCTAARRMLAFVECSSTQEQKKLFIQWNTAYYQFRLIIRHVMNGITHVFSSNFSAAVPLAVKSLYLHHCLMNNSLGGSTMSVNPNIIHSLIEKSVTSLSEELLESDLESVGELACSVLFDAIINWCKYADANHLEAARCSSRRISEKWSRQVKHYLGHAVECATASGLQTFAEIKKKLGKVELVLNQTGNDEQTSFEFKGHIPESPEDGEKLALKWKQMWLICNEHRILGP